MEQADVVVVAAGPGPAVDVPPARIVVAADGGLERARELGVGVDLVIGDLDSVPADALAAVERSGARVVRHPAAKDATDLELALDECVSLRAHRVLVLASAEGRLDHLLSSLLLLGADRYAGLQLDALVGAARVHVIRSARSFDGTPGELLTLLAVGGPAEGVATEGLAYPLAGEMLEPGSSRGVSNVFAADRARVSVVRGTLLAIRPGGTA